MLAVLVPLVSVLVAAISQEKEQSKPKVTSYGFDTSGRRGPALWQSSRYPPGWTLEEEAAEGHVFFSPAPPG